MELTIKKLEFDNSSTKNLPLWYNFILYNEMLTDEQELIDGIENKELGGYHLYGKFNKPISKMIDYSNMNFDDENEK
ncbi:hypothetical protein EV195_103247 [Tenacibaculum skagerrakense]|uniref:Uncharacterized protein n=1 Tax=Tenacibaculum skagerrakense TaxID=186571 RepID=A0A4R2NWT9_9FLAO|nr:hypothetical protein [Tenacibaculum skagerrakense]TCP25885.1 hypothetical protein EV195_103247 [Tenacibaculum skagerrakense]